MRIRLDIPADCTVPGERAVLAAQGIPDASPAQAHHKRLAQEAITLYRDLARPEGIILEIPRSEFAVIYEGEGRNEHPAPVEQIFPRCGSLALYAVTIGEAIGREISRLMATNDFPLGAMLDSAASEGTELTATFAEVEYARRFTDNPTGRPDYGILRFSPGYCGWDISGQKKLFEVLEPVPIGLSLNASFLMDPLKSISGVILAGPKEIFAFEDDYPICGACETHSCRERIKAVAGQHW